MPASVTPFVMFQDGESAAAMAFYTTLFNGQVLRQVHYGADGPGGPEASERVMLGEIEIAGQRIRFSDSPIKHAFGITPAVSLFVDVDEEAELDRLVAALGDGGSVLMPKGNYGFSQQFAWVADRFGVSWQLNLP